MEDIHEILADVCGSSNQDDVLATIIHVEGSAYKKEGASMLFKEDGSQVGMLSAGCLEEDLSARISSLGLGKRAEVIVYDMRGYNQLSWGEGSGCNGVIHVLIEPVTEQLRQHLTELKATLDSGTSVTMIKELPIGKDFINYIFTQGSKVFGNWQDDPKTLHQLKKLSSEVRLFPQKNGKHQMEGATKEVYVHQFNPKPRLIVIGTGNDAKPLVTFAAKTGFFVLVADWRPALCNKKNFPEANQHMIGFPQELTKQIDFNPNDYVVILTHNFERDKELLSYLLNEELNYLGVLGSARRTRRLLDGNEVPGQITSPIGLSIQAEGPEEIAISIVAELIQLSKMQKSKEDSIRETI